MDYVYRRKHRHREPNEKKTSPKSDEIKEYKERPERASHSQVSKRECQDDSLEPKAPKQVNEPKMVSRVAKVT